MIARTEPFKLLWSLVQNVMKKWSGFIDQKNFALSKCTQKWILCIDADECLSQELRNSIQEFILGVDQHSKVKGASFNRCCFFLGKWIKHGDWYPDRKLGLIQNGKAHWVGLNPHAKLSFTGDYKQKFLHGDLEHYSYDNIRLLAVKSLQYSDDIISNNKLKSNSFNLYVSVIIRPTWRFIRGYFIKLGLLDGAQGFVIALSTAYETLLKHGGLWESQNQNLYKKHLSNRTKGIVEK